MVNPRSVFHTLLRVPMCVSFSVKRGIFQKILRKHLGSIRSRSGTMPLSVNRNRCFEQTFQKLAHLSVEQFLSPLKISFEGEEGIDAGGVGREFYATLSKQMFNPNYSLFMQCLNQTTIQPSPKSYVVGPIHLSYFKFVGRMVGKAIAEGQLLDVYFTRSFYKHILSMPIVFNDLEGVDPELHKSLKMLLEMGDDVSQMDLSFETTEEVFGEVATVELKPGGRFINVTADNVLEYIMLVTEARMTKNIKEQIEAFCSGLYEIIPCWLLSMFDVNELELLISGMPHISVADMRKNTEYSGGYSASSKEISWFWDAVSSLSEMEKARLVQFITGTSKVPIGGFGNLIGMGGQIRKLEITRIPHTSDKRLPSAHTCFNQLELPAYSSYKVLRQKLVLAISEGSEGFGFA